jgi:hypothetical protein
VRSWLRGAATGSCLLAVLLCPPLAAAQHNRLDLVSMGPAGGDLGGTCCALAASADAGRVAFQGAGDVYLNDHGVVTRVSEGPTGHGGNLAGATPDVTHIYFDTTVPLVA